MAETPMKLVVDMSKNIHQYVPMTAEEIEQRAKDIAAHAKIAEAQKAEAEAKADAKLAAQAKLQALGLTGAEIAAITE